MLTNLENGLASGQEIGLYAEAMSSQLAVLGFPVGHLTLPVLRFPITKRKLKVEFIFLGGGLRAREPLIGLFIIVASHD